MLEFIKVVHAAGHHGTDYASTAAEGQYPPPSLEVLLDRCCHSILALGANNANLPKVIQIMADALAMDAMPMGHEARTRVINLCKQVQVTTIALDTLAR